MLYRCCAQEMQKRSSVHLPHMREAGSHSTLAIFQEISQQQIDLIQKWPTI